MGVRKQWKNILKVLKIHYLQRYVTQPIVFQNKKRFLNNRNITSRPPLKEMADNVSQKKERYFRRKIWNAKKLVSM